MKSKFYIILGLSLLAIMILSTLNATMKRPNKEVNGFKRKYLSLQVSEVARTGLDFNAREISSVENDSIFIAGPIPGEVYLYTQLLEKSERIKVTLPTVFKLAPVFYTSVDYPYLTILGGAARCIIHCNLKDKTCKITNINTAGFANAIAITDNSFIIRTTDSDHNSLFKKIMLPENKVLTEENISDKLGDGGFTYDGKLSYDPISNKLVFVSFYNNNLCCFDTSLHPIYKGHTIDTFRSSQTSLRKTKTSITFSKPPIGYNKYNYAFNGTLYVKSSLRADNELSRDDQTVIDTYSIPDGRYLGSFFIPLKSGDVRKFAVTENNRLVTLGNRSLSIFSLTKKQDGPDI